MYSNTGILKFNILLSPRLDTNSFLKSQLCQLKHIIYFLSIKLKQNTF